MFIIINEAKRLGDLYRAEEAALHKVSKPSTSKKVTRADIAISRAKEQQQKAKKVEEEKLKKKNISVQDNEVDVNINQVVAESRQEGEVDARNVEDAISALTTSEDLDRHPERRLKAAYKKYEDEQLPIIKAANPNMRMSQLKQLLFKQWQKAPENPLNQKHLSYNTK